jgi:threonine dehydratase
MSVTPAAVAERASQVAPQLRTHLPATPFRPFDELGTRLGAEVLVKCDHLQRTGSFKARGSLAKLMSLTAQERERGVVTASTGNHGLGVANALRELGGHGVVFVPENAMPAKVARLRRTGLQVHSQGADSVISEKLGRAYAAEHGMTYVAPYNDFGIISGQGTAGVEMLEQLAGDGLDTVFINVGGGGLVSGVASVLKTHLPSVRIVGASPANDAAMAGSIKAGKVVTVETWPTLSDGSAGNVEPGSITFELCRELVDEWVLIDESEIRAALRLVIDTERQLIEGSAAVAFAAALRADVTGQRIAIFSCGGNIDSDTLASALT